MSHALIPVKTPFAKTAHIKAADYIALYQESIENPEQFWGREGKQLDWIKPFSQVMNCSYQPEDVRIRWYEDGVLNVAANCLDRHLKTRADKTAIIWQGDDPRERRNVTYQELYEEVCRAANVLRQLGVGRGDRVIIYLPMIVEAAVMMLACARIGAIHSVVFGGFSPESLVGRIEDSGARIVITANAGYRGGKSVPFKANVDAALAAESASCVEKVLVVRRTDQDVPMKGGRDLWYESLRDQAAPECAPEPMGAEDPLFILYTSGSTGKPKGVVHSTGGYLVYAAMTHKYVFDIQENDVYWCTADVGWVTGHSYVVYGPLANGATTVMFEGVPNYPTPSRIWQVVDDLRVTILYTAPTAIRALMREGDEWVKSSSRQSLRLLGSVGEPINPEAWNWFYEVVGNQRCPIVDTWWQTETGGILITPLAGAIDLKPGSATKPFFGVLPVVLDGEGKEVKNNPAEGVLAIKRSWPGQMRTLWNAHDRFIETYFKPYPGYYFSGDGCRRDEEGYYWITGRVDDVINVSGHRIGSAEIESALVGHEHVAEAAVVAYPHPIKGQGIYAFVTLTVHQVPSEELKAALIKWVRKEIGPIATPDVIQWAPGLPKTRSGKIMRRILRKIAEDSLHELGDTSTLADPTVVEELIHEAKRLREARR
ncbi:MAG: acetate--CoA ligase [Holosporales bacterium]